MQTPETMKFFSNTFKPSNLVFLESYNTEFDEVIATFTDQNGRPLKVEEKVNLTLLIKK